MTGSVLNGGCGCGDERQAGSKGQRGDQEFSQNYRRRKLPSYVEGGARTGDKCVFYKEEEDGKLPGGGGQTPTKLFEFWSVLLTMRRKISLNGYAQNPIIIDFFAKICA
jgi:hypothetical protein